MSQLKDIRDEKSDYPIEFFCDQTEGFCTPFVAYVNNEPAAINWLVAPGEKSRFLDMKKGDVELNYITVLPAFRGNRLAAALMAYIIDRCKQEGQRRMFCVVHVETLPQYKQLIRLGFEPVEILTHFGPYRPRATLKYVKKSF
jgi:ribosomal protein S18 acetylase RimI-like enzyme